jgi:prepilin-type processing-associated H-X9-DG protein
VSLQNNKDDRNIYVNIRYLDIYDNKPEKKWQKIPNCPSGKDTMVMYFDGHAM